MRLDGCSQVPTSPATGPCPAVSPPPPQASPPPHSMDRPRGIVSEEPGSSPSDHSHCLSFHICEVEVLGTC